MKYSIKINPKFFKQLRKQVKQMPFHQKKDSLTFFLIFFTMLVVSMSIVFSSLDHLVEVPLEIDHVQMIKSYRTRRLEITANNQKYYSSYSIAQYSNYKECVSSDLLSGEVTSVVALVPEKQSIRDKLLNRTRMVDLRSNRNIYYNVEQEKEELMFLRIMLVLVIIPFCILMLALWFVTFIGGRKLFIKTKKKPKSKPK